MWNNDEIAKARAIRESQQKQKTLQAYNAEKAQLDAKYNNGGLGGFLGGIIGGIGKGISDVGTGIYDLIGSGVASAKDLIEGKAGTQENLQAFKKDLYKTDNMKDAYAKSAGTALNAATNLATAALPMAGVGKLGGVAANTAAGAIGGVADELQYQGKDASLESAANRAISGTAAGLVTGGLNRKIGNATGNLSSKLLNNKLATSTLGRGALSGAVGGATGAGTSAALGGGDIAQAALQGGLSGAVAGGAQAGLMSGANRIGQNLRNRVWSSDALQPTRVSSRINNDDTYRKVKTREDSIFNSDVAKQIGAQISDNDLDMYRRAQNGEILSRQEIDNSPIVKKFKEYANKHAGEEILTKNQETGVDTIDNQTMAKLRDIATQYMGTDDSLKTARNEGNAVIVLGLPASGKSSNAVDKLVAQGYFNLDNDNIKKLFPEYNGGLGAGSVHNASSYISNEMVLPEIANNRTNVVIPVIGKGLNSLEKYATILKNAGYGNIDLVNVELPTDKTATRNFTRMLETSRNVGMDYIYDVVGDRPTKNFNLIKERINNGTEPNFTSYSTLSTDVPFGADARVIEDSRGIWLSGADGTGYPSRSGRTGGANGGVETRGQSGQISSVPGTNNNLNSNNSSEPFMAYGESQLANRTRNNQAAEALRRFGNTLEGAQTNITRAAARDLDIESTGKVIENVRKKTGLTNLETQAQLARELTGGADSLMDTIQRNALNANEDGSIYTADTTNLLGEVESIVRKYANRTNMRGQAGLDRLVEDVRNDIMSRDTDLLSKANNFKASAAELRGKGIVNPSEGDSAKAKIYSEIGKKLDDLSYNAIPKDNVNDMFDATISEMRARATQAQNNGNKEIANAYNNLANNLDKQPRTIKAYRSFKKDFVDVAQINQLTARAENGAGLQLGNNAAGALRRFGNTVLNRPINSMLAKAGAAVNSAADLVDNLGTPTGNGGAPTQPLSQDVQLLLGNFIGRTEGQKASGDMVQDARRAEDYQNLESMLSGMQGGSEGLPMAQNGNIMGGYSQVSMNPVLDQLNQIQNAMRNAMAAGDIKAYSQLADIYKDAYAVYQAQAKMSDTGSTGSSMTTAEKNQIAKLQSAGTALDQLESLYQKAGGGQGVIGGNIANFLGGLGLNSDVNTYNQLAQGLINQIGAAIGKTDSLNTEGEVQRALSLVPKITDDNQTAMNKLSTLRQLLQTNTGTYNQLYNM